MLIKLFFNRNANPTKPTNQCDKLRQDDHPLCTELNNLNKNCFESCYQIIDSPTTVSFLDFLENYNPNKGKDPANPTDQSIFINCKPGQKLVRNTCRTVIIRKVAELDETPKPK